MDTKKLSNQNFIFSSNLDNPMSFFQGYCFVGADYIFGLGGAEKYYKEKGIRVEGGEDGCYVTVENLDNYFIFSSDFSGNKKIFYYWTPEIWVVSNSIFLIAQYLKENNVVITPNYSQLAAIGIYKSSFFNQLYSVNTFIEGVKLLPTRNRLIISNKGYSIEKIPSSISFKTYEEGLSTYIGTWVARLEGLLNNGLSLQSDLTGGADSRTVFTLLKKAAEYSESDDKLPVLRSSSTSNNTIDLEIATAIAHTYEFPINGNPPPIVNRFSGEDAFYSWKILCLGVYHPIYFPPYGPQRGVVWLGGAGAENHRHFYKYDDTDSFISSNASKILPSWLSYNVAAEIKSELNRMNDMGSKVDTTILHYREYRNRMHSGRTPQYISLFNPLGSKILEEVSEIAGSNRLLNGQINYDLMITLLPSILNIPFDHESKNFNEVRQKNITKLNNWIKVKPGKVYEDNKHDESNNIQVQKTKSALELLNEDFQTAKEHQFVKDFFGTNFINNASKSMDNALIDKRFPHAIDGQGIAAIIAGGLFD